MQKNLVGGTLVEELCANGDTTIVDSPGDNNEPIPITSIDGKIHLQKSRFDLLILDSTESDSQVSITTDERETILGKRNRQISTDSSGSLSLDSKSTNRKTSKKPKKKDCKKSSEDDEIDKILADLEDSACKPLQVLNEENAKCSTRDKTKKKKQKKQPFLDGDLLNREDKSPDSLAVDENANKPARDSSHLVDGKKERKKPGKKQLAAIQAALKKAKDDEERLLQEELAKQKKVDEAEKLKIEKLRLEEEKKSKKKQKEKDRKERLKAEGKFLTKSQRVARAKVEAALTVWRAHGIDVPQKQGTQNRRPYVTRSISSQSSSDSVSVEISESSEIENTSRSKLPVRQRHLTDPGGDGPQVDEPQPRSLVSRKRANSESNVANDSSKKSDFTLRSPVVCVLGHVDTGKTKLLDKIRKTNVQTNEAGNITQQIGATMVPHDTLQEKCSMVNSFKNYDLGLPGLLIIDTPGHESFRNMRSRGSSLCDIAILVVDIMHGIQQQTIESIELLKQKKTPVIVALNKVDRLYGWQGNCNDDIEDVIKRQINVTYMEFDKKCKEAIAGFAEQGLNAALFYENPDPRIWISMVPVSAVTGDGMGNLLAMVSMLCQNMLSKSLTFSDHFQATVLEVKTTAGLGTTLDVIVVNGYLKESDTIVLVGHDGPIVSQVRSLLMPQPLRELRVKNPYQEFKVVKGSQGVKVSGKDLDKAIAGLPLFVARSSDEVQTLKENVNKVFRSAMNSIKLSERGVYVQASTLGSLEALLDYLKSSDVPYSGVKVGPVVKKDVIKASVMLEHDAQYATILAFDVKIERDASDLAEHLGIKIFQDDIIYHLFDNYIQYRDELREKRNNDLKKLVVFPCKLKILPDFVVNPREPAVLEVRVEAGILRTGTPLCIPSRSFIDIGSVTLIESQNSSVECAKEGDDVRIRFEATGDEYTKIFGRHFDHNDLLVSKISRQSIDVVKEFYRDHLQKSDWNLMVELKKLFLIA